MMSTDSIIFEELLPGIRSVELAKVLAPAVPMERYLLQAANLEQWAFFDVEALTKVGVTRETLADMANRRIAAGIAQSVWADVLQQREERQSRWGMESSETFAVRDELVHYLLFAFRKNEHLQRRVQRVADGISGRDMIGDLQCLSAMARRHLDLLIPLAFEENTLTLAEQMVQRLLEIHGDDENEVQRQTQVKLLRDKAYTYLKIAVDAVRDAGQFVFWKTPGRLAGYVENSPFQVMPPVRREKANIETRAVN